MLQTVHRTLGIALVSAALLCPLAGCNGKQVKKDPVLARQQQLSEETLQMIRQYWVGENPWLQAPPNETVLRREVFQLRDRLIQAGQVVRPPEPIYDRFQGVEPGLELSYVGPPTLPCQQNVTVTVRLKNITAKSVRLCLWGNAFHMTFLHESGNVPKPRVDARAQRAMRIELPRPADFSMLAPGQSLDVPLPISNFFEPLRPGRYQMWVEFYNYWPGWRNDSEDDYRGPPVATPIVATEVIRQEAADGLACSLKLADEKMPNGGPVFIATLECRDEAMLTVHLLPGILEARDVGTGNIRLYYAATLDPAAPPPDDSPYPYRRPDDFLRLRAGETIVRRVRPAVWGSPDKPWLLPGHTYDIRCLYENTSYWYLDNGELRQVNAWVGHLASRPVTVTIPGAAE